MSAYVYRYIHPDYPWLYVGKTKNLYGRIFTHDNIKDDNIDRQYEELLLESSTYYIELENYEQASMVELYLIDKYKPTLNIKSKTTTTLPFSLETLPKWKKFVRKSDFDDLCNNTDLYPKKYLDTIGSFDDYKYLSVCADDDGLSHLFDENDSLFIDVSKSTKAFLSKIKGFTVANTDEYINSHQMAICNQNEVMPFLRYSNNKEIYFSGYLKNKDGKMYELRLYPDEMQLYSVTITGVMLRERLLGTVDNILDLHFIYEHFEYICNDLLKGRSLRAFVPSSIYAYKLMADLYFDITTNRYEEFTRGCNGFLDRDHSSMTKAEREIYFDKMKNHIIRTNNIFNKYRAVAEMYELVSFEDDITYSQHSIPQFSNVKEFNADEYRRCLFS